MIGALNQEFPVGIVCKTLGISTSSFYDYRIRKAQPKNKVKEMKENKVIKVFTLHQRRYGSRRIEADLKAEGINICRQQVARIMKAAGLKAIQPKSFVPKTTDSRQTLKAAPNLLLDRPVSQRPGEVWVGDITYIPLKQHKWAYLATWVDTYTHQVTGWSLDTRIKDTLIIQALKRGLGRFRTNPGMIVHSDRGRQYISKQFKKLLRDHNWNQSMSRRAEVYDNSVAESFFARLKCELIHTKTYESINELHNDLFEYIEGYYNPIRRHSSIHYKTPNEIQADYEN
ncbi:MAG: IS3 family transposase [Saprospiraceae bacterium]